MNPIEAGLVKLIFEKYKETRSSNAVYRWLSEHGHRQKTYTSRRKGVSGGRPFTVSGVQSTLTNRLYLGEIDHKGDIYPGQHDAIIDQETFDRVAAIMATNNKGAHGPPLRAQYAYLLTGARSPITALEGACSRAAPTRAEEQHEALHHLGFGEATVALLQRPSPASRRRRARTPAEPRPAYHPSSSHPRKPKLDPSPEGFQGGSWKA